MIDEEMRRAITEACDEFGQPESVYRFLLAMLDKFAAGLANVDDRRESLELVIDAIRRNAEGQQ